MPHSCSCGMRTLQCYPTQITCIKAKWTLKCAPSSGCRVRATLKTASPVLTEDPEGLGSPQETPRKGGTSGLPRAFSVCPSGEVRVPWGRAHRTSHRGDRQASRREGRALKKQGGVDSGHGHRPWGFKPRPRVLGTRGCGDSMSRTFLLSGPPARAWPRRGATGALARPLPPVSAGFGVSSEPQITFPPPSASCGRAFPCDIYCGHCVQAACRLGRKEANYCLWGAWSAVRVPARLPVFVRRAGRQATGHKLGLESRSEP